MTLAIIGHRQGHQLRAVTSTVETVEKVKTSQLQVGRRDGKGFGRGYVGEEGENMKRTRYITGTNYKLTRPINFQIYSESSIRPSLDLLSYHFGDLTCFPETDPIYGPQPSTR